MPVRKLKILKDNGLYKAGTIVDVIVDSEGMPKSNFLFRRVLDMPKDSNCEWVEVAKKGTKRPQTNKNDNSKNSEENK